MQSSNLKWKWSTPLIDILFILWFLQQLDVDVYGYEILLDYQVNQYVAPDGTKPFGKALDDQRAVCCWKGIASDH